MSIAVPVFFFHRVLPVPEKLGTVHTLVPRLGQSPSSQPLTLPLSLFRKQLALLKRLGYRTLSPQEFSAALSADRLDHRKACMLTFDDGTLDNLEYVLSACLEFGFRPLVFAIAGLLGQECPFGPPARLMSAEDLRYWQSQGGFIGCHSMTHVDLSTLPEDELHKEIVDAKHCLEDILGNEVTSFCYPRGRHGPAAITRVEQAGYAFAFTTRKGNRHRYTDRFLLKRVKVGRGTSSLRLLYRASVLYHVVHNLQKRPTDG